MCLDGRVNLNKEINFGLVGLEFLCSTLAIYTHSDYYADKGVFSSLETQHVVLTPFSSNFSFIFVMLPLPAFSSEGRIYGY